MTDQLRPTPETDAMLSDPSNGFQAIAVHARRLERERDWLSLHLKGILEAEGWSDLDSAPRDRSEIELLHEGGEISSAVWSQRPVCMLGPVNGGFPPGWATSGADDCDSNLPLREVTHWREPRGSIAADRDVWRDTANQALRDVCEVGEVLAAILEGHPEPCRLDHNGACQSHFMERNCSVARARAILARKEGE